MKSFVREGAGGRSTMMDVQGTDWLLTFLNNVTWDSLGHCSVAIENILKYLFVIIATNTRIIESAL